ncbi:hypothetical protein [Wenzhouxiangella marina]|uniref:Uncharacterized protein n=2 Tax=Wenzhouxiangella marina TaxID=1579979 RepID=A0A0K0XUQ8_9GAMM|nr:hypothetical protein [Wenzhouxiangella marina]AKS41400.1 hypothetical protein WM2015_1023 [Wenzhouxiangella marina]
MAEAPAISRSTIEGQERSRDLFDLRQAAIEAEGPWSPQLRAAVMRLSPDQMLEFLDDDDLLVRDEARDVVSGIYATCGVALGLLALEARGALAQSDSETGSSSAMIASMLANPGMDWCRRMSSQLGAEQARSKLNELVEITSSVDPRGNPQRVAVEQQLAQALEAGPEALFLQLQSDDALLVAMTTELLWEERTPGLVEDWSPMERLSQAQAEQVLDALYASLDCQFVGDCSLNNFLVSAYCFQPGFQCDGQNVLDGILYQSMSPSQFEAYNLLLSAIARQRAARRSGG